VTLFDQQLRSH
jgi:hypothetical protein